MNKIVRIRPITAGDIEAVLNIYRPFVENTTITFEYETPSLKEFTKRVEGICSYFPWLVCEYDGAIAAYSYASRQRERAAYQWNVEYSIYVNPVFHRRHIASALYSALTDLLAAQGFLNAYSLITVPNPKSVAFHQAFGFEPVAVYRSTGFKKGEWHDVFDMARQIAPLPEKPLPTIPFHSLDTKLVSTVLDAEGSKILYIPPKAPLPDLTN